MAILKSKWSFEIKDVTRQLTTKEEKQKLEWDSLWCRKIYYVDATPRTREILDFGTMKDWKVAVLHRNHWWASDGNTSLTEDDYVAMVTAVNNECVRCLKNDNVKKFRCPRCSFGVCVSCLATFKGPIYDCPASHCRKQLKLPNLA